jgi:hypothetical protein
VVPAFLSEKLFRFINNRKLVLDILLKFYDALYKDIKKFIWNVRCDIMIIKEQSYNINKKEKRKNVIIIEILIQSLLLRHLQFAVVLVTMVRFGN